MVKHAGCPGGKREQLTEGPMVGTRAGELGTQDLGAEGIPRELG